MNEFDESLIESIDNLTAVEHRLFDPDRKKRFESKEDIPVSVELSGYEIYPNKSSYETRAVQWVTQNTEKDFSKADDKPFVPPGEMGIWVTKRPRSIMKRSESGYIQYKGSGNPDQPNFPPRVNALTNDQGHEVLWAVSKAEVDYMIYKKKMLEKMDVPHTGVTSVVKLEEVPVPINGEGGFEIRDVRDAYNKPWEYADHVRCEEIKRMKRRLVKNGVVEDMLVSDEVVVDNYFVQEGFYQIQADKPLPFKNDIASLIESPTLLAYNAEDESLDLESQAQKVVWVAQEIGRSYGIEGLTNIELPSNFEVEDYSRKMEIVEKVDMPEELQRIDFRAMKNISSRVLSRKNAEDLKRIYGLKSDDDLVQIDGLRLYRRLIQSLSVEDKTKLQEGIDADVDQLVTSHIKSTYEGVMLHQAMQDKDTIRGLVSDYWLIGRPSVEDISDYDRLIRKIQTNEDNMRGSVYALQKLKGLSDEENIIFEELTVDAKIKAIMMVHNKVSAIDSNFPAAIRTYWQNIHLGKERYNDYCKRRDQLIDEYDRAKKEGDIKRMTELGSEAKEGKQTFPAFVKYVQFDDE